MLKKLELPSARLGQLLRFFRALQTSRVLHNSIVHAKAGTNCFNIVKIQLDIFGYSSFSELQSFPTLATRLLGFRHRVHRDRKVTQFSEFCLFGFHLNCKQHLMPHQGIRTFVCKYCSFFFCIKIQLIAGCP